MSGAFRDLAAGSRAQMCCKERAAKPLQTFENEYQAIAREVARAREGFNVVQMFQNIFHADVSYSSPLLFPLYKYPSPKKAVSYTCKNPRVECKT